MLKEFIVFIFALFYAIGKLFVAVITLIHRLISGIIAILPIVLALGLIGILGTLWFNNYQTVLPVIEEAYRCTVVPLWQDEISKYVGDFLLVLYDKGVIYWNGLSGIERAFANRVLEGPIIGCAESVIISNRDTLKSMIIKVYMDIILDLRMFFAWLSTGLTTNIYPFYIIIDGLLDVISSGFNILKCVCATGDPFWLFLQESFHSTNIRCTFHQAFTFALLVFQYTYNSIGISARQLIEFINGNSSTFLDPNFSISLGKALEVANAAIYYFFASIDELIENAGCVANNFPIYDPNNEVPFDNAFALCKTNHQFQLRLTSILSPLFVSFVKVVSTFIPNENVIPIPQSTRLVEVLFDFAWNSSNTIIEGRTDFLKEYATNSWRLDLIWDTLRVPVNRTSTLDTSIFLESFYLPNSSLPSCKVIYNNTFQSCFECSNPPNISLEEALCNFGQDFDNILSTFFVPYTNGLMQNIFCCFLGKVAHIIGEAFQFLSDRVKNLFMMGLFTWVVQDLSRQHIIDPLFDEVIGPQKITINNATAGGTSTTDLGILRCIPQFIAIVEPRLKCVGDLLVLLLKAIGETLRLIYYSLPGLINQIRVWQIFGVGGTTPNGVTTALFDLYCIEGPFCIDLEQSVFKYIRQSRILNGTGSGNIFLNYTAIDPAASPGVLECFCFLLNENFINSFLDPSQQLSYPDICCGLYFGLRIIIDLVKFLVGLIFALLETINDFLSNHINDIVVLSYLSCFDTLNGTTSGSVPICAIPELTSDARDFLDCPCLVIIYIDNKLGGSGNLLCLCNLITDLTNALIDGQNAIYNLAQVTVQILDCLSTNRLDNPSFPECDSILRDKFLFGFAIAENAINSLSLGSGALGCLVGTIFDFNCIDGSTDGFYAPCLAPACRPSDSLSGVFEKVFDTAAVIIIVPLRIIKGIFLAVFSQFTMVYGTFSAFLLDLLLQLGIPLFGNNTFPLNSLQGRGLVQFVGIFLNCILGPTNTCAVDQSCFGGIFILVGDKLRDVYPTVVDLFTNFVKLFELFFGGGSDTDILNTITAIFQDILTLLEQILISIPQILTFLKNIFLAFVRVFFPFGNALADVLDVILTVLINILGAIVNAIVAVLQFFGLISKKRTLLGILDIDIGYYNTYNIIINIRTSSISDIMVPLLENVDAQTFCGRLYRKIGLIDQSGHVPNVINAIQSNYDIPLHEELMTTGCLFLTLLPIHLQSNLSIVELLNSNDDTTSPGGSSILLFNLNDISTRKRGRGHVEAEANAYYNDLTSPTIKIGNDTLLTLQNSAKFFLDIVKGFKDYSSWQTTNGYILGGIDKTQLVNAAQNYNYDSQFISDSIGDHAYNLDNGITQFVPYNQIVGIDTNGGKVASSILGYYEQNMYYSGSRQFINLGFNTLLMARMYNQTSMNTSSPTNGTLKRSLYDENNNNNQNNNNHTNEDLSKDKKKSKEKASILLFDLLSARINTITTVVQKSFSDRWQNTKLRFGSKNRIFLMLKILPFGNHIDALLNISGFIGTMKEEEGFSQRRSLQVLPPTTNISTCTIYDDVIGDINNEISYVIARQDVVRVYFTGKPLYKVTPYTGPSFSQLYANFGNDFLNSLTNPPFFGALIYLSNLAINTVNSIAGIDLGTTAFDFISNTNLDKDTGFVGLAFFLKFDTHIPHYSECSREINLQCNYGYGLKRAFLYTTVIFLVIVVILFALIPLLGHFTTIFLGILGIMLFSLYLYTMAILAWNFSPTCLLSPNSFILSLFIPSFPILPLVPECAGVEIYDLINSLFTACPIPWPPDILVNGTSVCPTCPNRLQFVNCQQQLGVTSGGQFFGEVINDFFPPLFGILNIIPGLFDGFNPMGTLSTNGTLVPNNGTSTFNSRTTSTCYYFLLVGTILSLDALIALLVLLIPFIIFIVEVILIVLVLLIRLPPVVYIYRHLFP